MGIVLADPHLPNFFYPHVCATPAYKHRPASHPPHKLNGSYKARYRIILSTRQ